MILKSIESSVTITRGFLQQLILGDATNKVVLLTAQRLKQKQGILYGSDLGALHLCYVCVAGGFCRTPNIM